TEILELNRNIEHIKEIVAMQQGYARISGVTEIAAPAELIERAVRLKVAALERHGIRLVREYSPVPDIIVEKGKVLQILVNLISNAKLACEESAQPKKQLTLKLCPAGEAIEISVIDNGVGIPAAHLTRIFNHGFTTRKDGHGFGLHSSALAAKEMGGLLTAYSEGPGQGARFTLRLPTHPPHAYEQSTDTTQSPGPGR
ncbi:MAG TPA: HAMP domain-containing sensor histidine kinase, partial [Verrucomicrobiae bacterium]